MSTVNAAPTRDWSFILFKMAGAGLAEDIKTGLNRLDQAGTSPDAYVAVRAEQDKTVSDFTVDTAGPHHLKAMPGGVVARSTKQTPMMDEGAIRQFLIDTMTKYPAQHVYVAFEGHSHDIRHAMANVHQALVEAQQATGKKVDVLAFDACFLAQLESAAQFQDVANTLVASEETMAGWRPVEEAANKPGMTPKQLAEFFVSRSDEFTLSAFDLTKAGPVMAQAKQLSDAILAVHDEKSIRALREAIAGSQHFFTDGVRRPDTWHNSVDVYDCMEHILANPWLSQHEPALLKAAQGLRDAVTPDPNGFVFAEKHQTTPNRDALVDITDVRRAHGSAIYLPHTAPVLRDHYIHFPNSTFNQITGFDAAIAHLTGEKSPGYVLGSAAENAGGIALQGIRSAAEGAEAAAEAVKKAVSGGS